MRIGSTSSQCSSVEYDKQARNPLNGYWWSKLIKCNFVNVQDLQKDFVPIILIRSFITSVRRSYLQVHRQSENEEVNSYSFFFREASL